ncbi:MAG: YitT family protein [Bacteroidales bacterium]|nr:YitT family protein [Bacteroidales bacterium]
MTPKLHKVLLTIFDYIVISFGCLLFVMGWTSFLLPNGIIDGGLTGICALLSMVTGIPVEVWNFGLNGLLLIIAWIVLGRSFGIKTVYAIILTSLLFRVLGGDNLMFLKSVAGQPLEVGEKVLVPIIGGLLEAVGLGIILLRGGSTGGTDILALIINKFWPVSLGRFYLISDFIVIGLLMFIPGHCFADVIYGYICMGVFAFALDLVMMGKESAVQVLVFSDQFSAIGNYINQEMGRGVTALRSIGWYTQQDRQVLLVMLRKTELPGLVKVIKEIDPKAFVTVVPANNVYGEGFDEMKTGLSKTKKK